MFPGGVKHSVYSRAGATVGAISPVTPPLSAPTPTAAPAAPKDALEALEQRRAKYQEMSSQAKANGDDRKARMHDRITKVDGLFFICVAPPSGLFGLCVKSPDDDLKLISCRTMDLGFSFGDIAIQFSPAAAIPECNPSS